MKVFICVLLILAILITGFIANYFYLKNKSDAILDNLLTLQKFAEKSDFENCKKSYDTLYKNCEECKDILFIFSNHKDLDDIYKSMLKIKVRVDYQKYDEVIEETEVAKQMIKDVPAKEAPTLENIF